MDAYLAAGNAECVSGQRATAARRAARTRTSASSESPASNEVERIDFYLLPSPHDGFRCNYRVDSPTDADGDGTATRLFTDEPNPFASSRAGAPLPICWPSGMQGVQLDLNCG